MYDKSVIIDDQLVRRSSSCTGCYLKRSNALRRRRRPTIRKTQSAENILIIKEEQKVAKNENGINKNKRIKKWWQFVFNYYNEENQIPRFVKWKYRKIHPMLEASVLVNLLLKRFYTMENSKDKRKLLTIADIGHIFFKVHRQRRHLKVDERIQQIDGGFFEKFGALFTEHTELTNKQENNHEIREPDTVSIRSSEEVEDQTTKTTESTDEISSDSELEIDQKEKATDFISTAFNIDELYSEILYEILHNVGCDVSYEIGQTALFSYAQDAFKMPNDKHNEIMSIAEKKEPPELLLNVEVIEAKDLRPKDSNGLSDPFVTLYLASNSAHRYNTSVKTATLSPVWEEHFALPINEGTNDDTLCLEVWDFDPAESVKEKLGKIFEVKGVKGIRKLVKEIAVTAATGQHENELIGIAKVPLKTIPASGLTMWYSLDKKNKVQRQGVVKIRISFSAEKNSQVAEQEHRHLLRIILLHELETSKVAPYWWCGSYSPQAEALLTQHIAQSGLNPTEVAICQYAVFSSIHSNHPLNFTLFSNLLEKLLKPLQIGSVNEEDVKLFWDSSKKLLPSCFSVIRKIRKKNLKDKANLLQLTEVLRIINMLSSLEPSPITMDLFSSNLYPSLNFNENDNNCDIKTVLNGIVTQGANDWFNHILETRKNTSDENDSSKLQHLIQVIQLIRSDLQKAVEFHDKLFQEIVNFQYAKALYTFYQARLSTLIEPEVTTICKGLKRLLFTNNTTEFVDTVPLNEGTSLFEVYLALQRFVLLGKGLCPTDYETFHIKNFHRWFHGGVAHWLDIAVFKALQRIEKAVELDSLVPVDSTVKYSSSAVDTLTIYYQVKVFWQQLNWPDVEGCYTFIAKIIDDICRCCVYYADKMSQKVDGMGDIKDIYDNKKFEVTNEWCLAINNIEYVRQSLQPFTEELGMDEIIQKLSDLKSPIEAQRCQHTLENVIANAIDTVRNKIIELQETVVAKMVPAMKRLLIEGAELFNQDSNSIDRLMLYVDNNLSTLHKELNEENFNRMLEILWDTLSEILNEIIQSNIDKRRPPSFFANLHKTFNLMLGSFKNPSECSNCDSLRMTEQLLKINGMETAELIHQVHLDLYEQYKTVKDSPYGEILVKAQFEDNNLIIEVINARNLMAMDSNGSCDSFIRIHILPEHKFTNVSKFKTQIHHKTLFPLYDERFTINLTPEQKQLNGLILFSVKDHDLLGYNNQYIGEALMHFKDANSTQVYLALSRPSNLTTNAIKALESRQGDKQAKEFLKKFKQRMGS